MGIFAPIQQRNDVGPGKSMKLQREETLSRKFGHPDYITRRDSQLRVDLRSVRRRPDMINRLAHCSVGGALLGIVYQAESTYRHVNIAGCPCNDLVNKERKRRYPKKT